MSTDSFDHYTVLGVARTADRQTIQRSYRALARRMHPDFGGDPTEMARINEAWRVLGDPKRRAAYDGPRLPQRETAQERTGSRIVDFGRYTGWTLAEIANADDDYLYWLSRTPAGQSFRPEIEKIWQEREAALAATRPSPPQRRRRGWIGR
jgi:curved DNA-binding protein CbpA